MSATVRQGGLGTLRSVAFDDRYGRDVLGARDQTPRRPPTVDAEDGLVVEDPVSGFCGAIVGIAAGGVILQDRRGGRRHFPLRDGAFLLDGRPVTLRAPRLESAPRRSASGSIAVPRAAAQVARASRIWVEGTHDATLIERIWGHDLRVEAVVVEPLDGLDRLPAALAEFRPGPGRRVGVLADHFVPGTKETRLVESLPASDHVLITGHPYVDIWQAVKPARLGIAQWPAVPRGRDWKEGVCAALGFPDVPALWARIDRSVAGYRDVETPLITAVERLIDFVTGER